MSIDIEIGSSTAESRQGSCGGQWLPVPLSGADQGAKSDGGRRRAGSWIGWGSAVLGAGGMGLGCGVHGLAGSTLGDVVWAAGAVGVLTQISSSR
jgi:hypothetical protein